VWRGLGRFHVCPLYPCLAGFSFPARYLDRTGQECDVWDYHNRRGLPGGIGDGRGRRAGRAPDDKSGRDADFPCSARGFGFYRTVLFREIGLGDATSTLVTEKADLLDTQA